MAGLADFAGCLYAQPGVQRLLLVLQDEAGQDVLLLLTACWLGRRRIAADARLWQSLHACQTPWRERIILPLRQVRRTLAGKLGNASLYEQVKACELATEWHQLDRLEQLCQEQRSTEASPHLCILTHLAHCCGELNDDRLKQLATVALG